MSRKAYPERGIGKVESGIDPDVVPVEDEQSGDEGIDDVRAEEIQNQKEPLDPPQDTEET